MGTEINLKSLMKTKPKETKSAGGVVLNLKGEVLVVSQHGKSWSLPKGHIEAGEDVLVAAKREIYEESGLTELQLVRELGTYQRHRISKDGTDDVSELKAITLFLFKTKQTSIKPIDADNPEGRWVEKDAVAELLTHPADKAFFLKIKREI